MNLNVRIQFINEFEFSIKINDSEKSRWELPEREPFPHDREIQVYTGIRSYEVLWEVQPFSMSVRRKETGEVLFDLGNSDFIYSNNYLEFSTIVPTKHFFGLGERAYTLDFDNGVYTMMNKDQPSKLENGTKGNNLYGFHPMWLTREKSNKYNVILFRNVNSLDFTVSDIPLKKKKLKFQVIGGILEYRFFIGNYDPEDTLRLYHRYVGGWRIPSFWSFGSHQSRWGYGHLDNLI